METNSRSWSSCGGGQWSKLARAKLVGVPLTRLEPNCPDTWHTYNRFCFGWAQSLFWGWSRDHRAVKKTRASWSTHCQGFQPVLKPVQKNHLPFIDHSARNHSTSELLAIYLCHQSNTMSMKTSLIKSNQIRQSTLQMKLKCPFTMWIKYNILLEFIAVVQWNSSFTSNVPLHHPWWMHPYMERGYCTRLITTCRVCRGGRGGAEQHMYI